MTQKAKILGVTVDVTMLEFIVAIGSSTAYVLYNKVWSQSNRGVGESSESHKEMKCKMTFHALNDIMC